MVFMAEDDVDGTSATIVLAAILSEGWWNITMSISDVAGNTITIVMGDFGVDLSPPTFMGAWPPADIVQPDRALTCTITVREAISGITTVEWRAWWPGQSPGDWIPALWNDIGDFLPFTASSGSVRFPPGDEGRIEWRAVDETGREVISGALAVWVNRQPVARISSPAGGGRYQVDATLKLTSESTDPDGQTLVETWYSDIDGELGQGSEVLSRLSEGEHVLTLRVEDPMGSVNETSVQVEITDLRLSDASLILIVVIVAVIGILLVATVYRKRSGKGP